MIHRHKCKRQKGFEVQWCSDLASDGAGGCEPDRATYVQRDFDTIGQATAYAKEVYPRDCFGSVRIAPFEMVPVSGDYPNVLTREYTAEPSFVDTP